MKTHTARWFRNGLHAWILKERMKDGSAILGRIEQTKDGWVWADCLGAGGIAPSRYAAQRAVRRSAS